MGFQQKLTMRQSQGLVMTPQLSQSIKLLALNNIELTAFVESELEQNPFLERGDGENATTVELRREDSPNPLTGQEPVISAQTLQDTLGTSVENAFPDEQDYRSQAKSENALGEARTETRPASGGMTICERRSSHDAEVSDYTASQPTLADTLRHQLALAALPPLQAALVSWLILQLDEAGYCRLDLTAAAQQLGCAEQDMQDALAVLQTFEPAGIGARDLAQCLALQLHQQNRLDPAMARLLENLPLLAKRDFTALTRITGLDGEDLHDALMEIRALDPKPATAFDTGEAQHIVHDVTVTAASDGTWRVELNNDTLPRVLVDRDYAATVDTALKAGGEDRSFVADCLQNAHWLTRSLDQRAQTIMKVATEIVKQQDGFFLHGVSHLRPLTLKKVADAIDMHESSVSRVTSNKYMMTPRGLFELKYFFTTGLSGVDGENVHSSEAVRDMIRTLVNAETARTVLSDDAIVTALQNKGIEIARRTVAKYRDGMNIASSVQRRRELKALAAAKSTTPSPRELAL
ncbi:MAG: RNA polymerase factor sigma-54 [Pseudomonadota bacterium]